VAALAGAGVVAALAWGATIKCQSGVECTGTKKADRISGTGQDDRILAKGGRDEVEGRKGSDHIEGNGGDDDLYGRAGSESFIFGGIFGGGGDDRIDGGGGSDQALYGGRGKDRIFGGKGADFLDGLGDEAQDERDILNCGPGTDTAVPSPKDVVKDNCEQIKAP
jgi:Ca2+-binding RTX toxin-like protein